MKNIFIIFLLVHGVHSFHIGRQIIKRKRDTTVQTGKKYIVDIDGTICFTEKKQLSSKYSEL